MARTELSVWFRCCLLEVFFVFFACLVVVPVLQSWPMSLEVACSPHNPLKFLEDFLSQWCCSCMVQVQACRDNGWGHAEWS